MYCIPNERYTTGNDVMNGITFKNELSNGFINEVRTSGEYLFQGLLSGHNLPY